MRRIVRPILSTPAQASPALPALVKTHAPNLHRYKDDSIKDRLTFSQLSLRDELIRLLKRKKYIGRLLCDCEFPFKRLSGCWIGRAPDFMLPRLGIVIEDDGSAHDDCPERAKKDMTRDSDWKSLGFVVIRFSSDEIKRPEGLSRVMQAIEALIDERGADPDCAAKDAVRRVKIHRNQRAYDYQCAAETGTTPAPRSPRKSTRAYKVERKSHRERGGLVYYFTSTKSKPHRARQAPISASIPLPLNHAPESKPKPT